ncbi:hypothetical protein GCWU000321_01541 [Dialister invisus DSM 15470]|uniref:DUF1934 domain-containing protein n=1 Tax=Dialister invisus DSM 15470 TaxID=592028 RepID=C9LPR1_9FIRM|nr:DUF1934 domain-containing protein [Dialister invisus]EEW97547.1 hypothetical protein GCWU000321_01541 [Dialister invisus DSM 15470]
MFEEGRGTVEKQVMIRCKSIQRDERGKAEEVVLETPGVYGEDEDCRYLTYEETSLSGMEGTTTTIRMYGDHVTLSRQGSFLQETEYRPGTVAKSEYITPAGPVEITVSSKEITDTVSGGKGRLRLVYDIEMKGLFSHLNEIIIDVREESETSWKSEKN